MHTSLKNNLNFSECKQQIDIETIASRLRDLMEKHKVSTLLLSKVTGISVAAINGLKRAEGNPTIGTLNSIASWFNLSLLDFIGLDQNNNTQQQSMVIPIFNLRYANQRTPQNINQKLLIEKPKNVDLCSMFGVITTNNSLSPLYEKGTIFIISEHQKTSDCDIVLACIQNNLNVIKRIFMKNNEAYFKNINFDDSIEKYNKNYIKILGVVVQIIQRTV